MSNCAVVGINWGDEGKGRMVDLIAKDYDIVIRYQGGNNAGHTIVNEYGKFALHLIPSGIFSDGVVNVLGNGVVIDLEDLCREIDNLRAHGIRITPENLKISERATIVFPFHRALDGLEEARLKDQKYGSTLRGIAPVYSDKYQKKTVMLGELLYPAPQGASGHHPGVEEPHHPQCLRRRALQARGHARLVRGVRRQASPVPVRRAQVPL